MRGERNHRAWRKKETRIQGLQGTGEGANGGGGNGSAFSHCLWLQVPCFYPATRTMLPASTHSILTEMVRRTRVGNLEVVLDHNGLIQIAWCILDLWACRQIGRERARVSVWGKARDCIHVAEKGEQQWEGRGVVTVASMLWHWIVFTVFLHCTWTFQGSFQAECSSA